jgi:hypothetical protein
MPLADNYRGISTLNKLLFSRCYILVLPGDNWCPIILVITGDIGNDVNTLYSTFRTRYDNAFDVMNLLITC